MSHYEVPQGTPPGGPEARNPLGSANGSAHGRAARADRDGGWTRAALLGRVAAEYLRDRLDAPGRLPGRAGAAQDASADGTDGTPGGADGTARFIVDCLSADQTAAIARAILADADLAARFDLKLPAGFLAHAGLPAAALTTERATYYRNAPCDRPALLLANTGDDEEQSLRDLTSVSTADLQSQPELWVAVAGADLPLSDEARRWWQAALRGLQDLRFVTLDRFAEYVLRTRALIADEGQVLLAALGAALPVLRLPADTHLFDAIQPRQRGQASRWRALFQTAHAKRACYLSKQTPSGGVLTTDDLATVFARVRESIPEAAHAAVDAFVAAPAGWTAASAALAACEWETVRPLFDGLGRERFNLGQATLDFYAERDPDLVSDADRDYLARLVARRTTGAELDEDRRFYDAHREQLRDDRKLASAWDRFVFGTPKETRDFVDGLIRALEALPWDAPAATRTLVVSSERRFKRDLRDMNAEAGLYFARRYRGLKALFGRDVRWDVGELFEFADLVTAWRDGGQKLNTSEAKSAVQLKFTVELELETPAGAGERYSAQFVWRFDPQWIACEFANDWARLVEHPLVFSRVDRESAGARSGGVGAPARPASRAGTDATAPPVDLWNVRTLTAAYGQARGSLVGAYKPDRDLARAWRARLAEARERGYVAPGAAERLADRFDAFASAYADAIRGFAADGLASSALDGQLTAYGAVLDAVCREAPGDRNRAMLLRPLLEIGIAAVAGPRPAAIIAPWQPLRLAAIARKARRVADLLRTLLAGPAAQFGDARLFFADLHHELAHVHYPEVAAGWRGERAELLACADVAADYSLHESPIAGDAGADATNDSPADGAARVTDLVQRYLALHPHERANLSVVLYNCDSARLPMAVVDRLGALQQDDEDARCQIVLRHRDAAQLRALYEQIVEASDGDGDAFVASEATRDFMARLRIGIMADQAPPPDPREGCPEDIVFSQDVVARHARLEWYLVGARPADGATLNPAQWSRRRPAATGDMKSVVYLCCPVQRAEGWAYLTALATCFRGDWDGDAASRFLPARQLDFQDPATAQIVEETHNLGTWVVNYDELLDRRQLAERGVRVIRYKQAATQGRNLIVSSRAPTGLLRSMVAGRLRDLHLPLDSGAIAALADRFIRDANDVSGDIVLRAARRGRSASELIGLVLSQFLLRHELGSDQYAGWYFLDDYADWLGQREQQIADLLALSPGRGADGGFHLTVLVAEAKYVDATGAAAKRKESQRQLRDTLRRIAGVVAAPSTRLDRGVWLARLSDLLVDGVRLPAGGSLDLAEWRRAIREGRCGIEVRGYSHVFVSGPADAPDPSARVPLPVDEIAASDARAASELTNDDTRRRTLAPTAFQEVFGRDLVRDLVLRYARGDDPTPVRDALDGGAPIVPATSVAPAGFASRATGSPSIAPAAAGPDMVPQTEQAPASAAPAPSSVPDGATLASDAAAALSGSTGTAATGDGSGGSVSSARATPCGPSQEPLPAARWAYAAVDAWVADGGPEASDSAGDEAWLRQVEAATRTALQQFQLQAKLLGSSLTPNAALLKFQGSASLTVDQVLRRRTEFLTTHGLTLVGVQPEPGVVALSIARPRRQAVPLRGLWRRWAPDVRDGNRALLIGVREDDGGLLVLSPGEEHAPHTLIAGATGSGKSVLMQNILLSIAATNRPDQARITLIDPKQGVDYFAFEHLPHLDGGIVDQQADALARIRALVAEMDARYVRLRQARAPNLRAYNARAAAGERLPTLWLIHDEFAEWMLADDYKAEVTAAVARLGVKARAAGIHLVFAAQRPEASVMPMQLRANLGNRLVLRVDSEGTSEIALGERGAERLLGRGHLLAKLEGGTGLTYAQVPYADPADLDTLVAAIADEARGTLGA